MKAKHRGQPNLSEFAGYFVWLLGRVAMIVALLMFAIVLIVTSILVVVQAFIFFIERGAFE